MNRLLKFDLETGNSVVVEVDETEPGYERVSRDAGDVIVNAAGSLESAFEHARLAANALIEKFRGLDVLPGEIEVEFGVRLNAEVGAVIAKTQTQGHFKVNLKWSQPTP